MTVEDYPFHTVPNADHFYYMNQKHLAVLHCKDVSKL